MKIQCEKTRIGQNGAEAPNVTVKQEKDGGGTGQSRVVDIDGECARQLQTDLDEQYMIEEATRVANRQLSLIAPGVVVYVVDSDSNEDAEFEEWSDHEHECLVEIDRRLREQEDKDAAVAKKCQEEAEREAKEQQAKDEELARKCEQEMEQKAREQVANDNHVARLYQKLYDQIASDEQIKMASAHDVVGHPVHHDARGTRTRAGRASGACVQNFQFLLKRGFCIGKCM